MCVLLTGPLVKHIVEGAIGHPVCNYDWMRGGRSLTRPQHGQHIGVGEDSTAGETGRMNTQVQQTTNTMETFHRLKMTDQDCPLFWNKIVHLDFSLSSIFKFVPFGIDDNHDHDI